MSDEFAEGCVYSKDDDGYQIYHMTDELQCVTARPNDETYPTVDEHEDTREDLTVWTIACCPDPDKACSKASWKRHQPWSMESEGKCLNALAYHFKHSGLHAWKDGQISSFFTENRDSIEIVTTTDTYETRQEYRRQLERTSMAKVKNKEQAKKDRQSGERDPSGSNEKNQIALNLPMHSHPALAQSMALLFGGLNAMDIARNPRDNSDMLHIQMLPPIGTFEKLGSMVTIPREQLMALRDAAVRSESATQETMINCVNQATKHRIEWATLRNVRMKIDEFLKDQNDRAASASTATLPSFSL